MDLVNRHQAFVLADRRIRQALVVIDLQLHLVPEQASGIVDLLCPDRIALVDGGSRVGLVPRQRLRNADHDRPAGQRSLAGGTGSAGREREREAEDGDEWLTHAPSLPVDSRGVLAVCSLFLALNKRLSYVRHRIKRLSMRTPACRSR